MRSKSIPYRSYYPIPMDTQNKETQLILPLVDYQQQPEPTAMPIQQVAPQLKHVCDICHRGFSTGQALGGHKSKHFRDWVSASNPVMLDTKRKRKTREPAAGYPSSCSSPTRHDESSLSRTLQSPRNSVISDSTLSDDGECGEAPLPSCWPSTRKRSRRPMTVDGTASSSNSDSDHETVSSPNSEHEKFSALLMLADLCVEVDRNLRTTNIETKIECAEEKKKWSAADYYGYNCKDIVEEHQCRICNKTFPSFQGLGGHMSSHNRVKKNSEDQTNSQDYNNEFPPPPQQVHKCSICDKSFSSYQALGGHKSSHCVKNIKPLRSVFNGEFVTVTNVVEPQLFNLSSNFAALFGGAEDYNSTRHKLYETATHQCRTCNEIFPTGQALGGHMRRHYIAPPIQLNLLNSGGVVHDFDLNVPPIEEEQSYQTPLCN